MRHKIYIPRLFQLLISIRDCECNGICPCTRSACCHTTQAKYKLVFLVGVAYLFVTNLINVVNVPMWPLCVSLSTSCRFAGQLCIIGLVLLLFASSPLVVLVFLLRCLHPLLLRSESCRPLLFDLSVVLQ